jgi:hypothetical protein
MVEKSGEGESPVSVGQEMVVLMMDDSLSMTARGQDGGGYVDDGGSGDGGGGWQNVGVDEREDRGKRGKKKGWRGDFV